MTHPKISMGKVSNIWSRMMHFEKEGDVEQGHTHDFDHLTLLASGALKITVDGQATEFKAPHMIFIHKDKRHELVALEDNTVAYCIHSLTGNDHNVQDYLLDENMIPKGVNL